MNYEILLNAIPSILLIYIVCLLHTSREYGHSNLKSIVIGSLLKLLGLMFVFAILVCVYTIYHNYPLTTSCGILSIIVGIMLILMNKDIKQRDEFRMEQLNNGKDIK